MNLPYRVISPLATATATALLLHLPAIAGADEALRYDLSSQYKYTSLADAGPAVVDAVAPPKYYAATTDGMFSFLSDVAFRVLSESTSLDPEFSALIDKEFWSLL